MKLSALHYVLIFLLIASVSSCKDGEPNTPIPSDSSQEPKADTVTYTAIGSTESYEPILIIYPQDTAIKTPKDLPDFDILHVIPERVDAAGMGEYMHGIYGQHFALEGIFGNHSGDVRIFYDKEKQNEAALFTTVNGKPDGKVIVYTVNGDMLLDRDYDNGTWVKSGTAPACSDWNYDSANSTIVINDLENGETSEDGTTTITLMPSLQSNADYSAILDESSFKRPFKVNSTAFTGKLLAHNRIPNGDNYLAFELNFKDGLLHGDAKVYDEFKGLVTDETFRNGTLIPLILPPEPVHLEPVHPTEKPIIYFYPEDTTELVVKLNFDGQLTHTYPKYQNQWKVTAHPNGTLLDENGQEFYALYWEGESDRPFTVNEGTVVSGENTVAFLEESLETLGLNRREANEFIMYWLPRMENNAFNLIHFSTDEYEEMAELDIQPNPETLIRVMMVFEPLESSITIPEQDLEAIRKTRKGFTVVEWGGTEVKDLKLF